MLQKFIFIYFHLFSFIFIYFHLFSFISFSFHFISRRSLLVRPVSHHILPDGVLLLPRHHASATPRRFLRFLVGVPVRFRHHLVLRGKLLRRHDEKLPPGRPVFQHHQRRRERDVRLVLFAVRRSVRTVSHRHVGRTHGGGGGGDIADLRQRGVDSESGVYGHIFHPGVHSRPVFHVLVQHGGHGGGRMEAERREHSGAGDGSSIFHTVLGEFLHAQ